MRLGCGTVYGTITAQAALNLMTEFIRGIGFRGYSGTVIVTTLGDPG